MSHLLFWWLAPLPTLRPRSTPRTYLATLLRSTISPPGLVVNLRAVLKQKCILKEVKEREMLMGLLEEARLLRLTSILRRTRTRSVLQGAFLMSLLRLILVLTGN